jgi:hypothetical protein
MFSIYPWLALPETRIMYQILASSIHKITYHLAIYRKWFQIDGDKEFIAI